MRFRLLHHQLRGLILKITRPVPVDDHAVNASAHHVIDLALHLIRVDRAVADVHVARLAEPYHQVRVDPGGCAGIKERMNVGLADIPRAEIAVGLGLKRIGSAGIVAGLSCKRGGWNYER